MNTKEQTIIKRLKGLADGTVEPIHYDEGICYEVDIICLKRGAVLQPLMTAHPDYSGNLKYPIPHPTMAARDAYMDAYNLWDIDTAYGRTRREWCKWLADRLEEKYILGDKQ